MEIPPRFNVLGVGVHALNLMLARDLVIAAARQRQKGYVCCCDVNSVSCARRDPEHLRRLNRAFLTTPDGMPIVWLGRRTNPNVSRVYGPDLLLAVCAATASTELRHYFYGAGPGTAEALAAKLTGRFPGLRIAGADTPPFRALGPHEHDALAARLRELRPDFFWVGLSTPKQERFMADESARLDAGLMLGVGAAFDFLSGRVRQAPLWAQRSGLEWLWRLSVEPRRLGPRYLRNNPAFLFRLGLQVSRLKKYPLDAEIRTTKSE